jgi:predicted esterase
MEHHLQIKKRARYFTYGEDITKAERIWFVLHGYGQLGAYFIRNFHVLDSRKNFIVAPEGLHRFYLDGVAGRVGASWMTKEDRETDIRDYVDYLSRLYAEIVQKAGSEKEIWIFGFSQGVATAARWIVLGKPRFDKAIFWAGSFPPDLEPLATEEAFRKPEVPCVYGDSDEFINNEQIRKAQIHLEKAGLTAQWHSFPGGHKIPPEPLLDLVAKIS